jgi:soluble lytic murein transglycosylase-like protein
MLGGLAVLAVGSAALTSYRVRPGDTLSSVSARTGVPVDKLVAENHLRDANLIFVDQHLAIPAGDSAPASPRGSPVVGQGVTPGHLPAALTANRKLLALRPRFRYWAGVYNVPPALLEGLAWMESGWRNNARSSSGAIGIGQLEPSTVAFINTTLLHERLDPHVADANIRMTTRYLRLLLDQTNGDVPTAVAAYYQGLQSVIDRGLLHSTRRYVSGVLTLRVSFSPG